MFAFVSANLGSSQTHRDSKDSRSSVLKRSREKRRCSLGQHCPNPESMALNEHKSERGSFAVCLEAQNLTKRLRHGGDQVKAFLGIHNHSDERNSKRPRIRGHLGRIQDQKILHKYA